MTINAFDKTDLALYNPYSLPSVPYVLPVPTAPDQFELSFKRPSQISDETSKILEQQGFTKGLIKSLTKNMLIFPWKVWIIDNSGSMNEADGHCIFKKSKKHGIKTIAATRWSEVQECVVYHAELAGHLQAHTIFNLLNNPGANVGAQQNFSVGERISSIEKDVDVAKQTIRKSQARGNSPITKHIYQVVQHIEPLSERLKKEGKKIAVVVATDGIPTNELGREGSSMEDEFVEALKCLEKLPVWIVFRLCTDDEMVLQFYNGLDERLERPFEVLNDFFQEAKEVHQFNKWLNYALPLHRCREMGYHNRLFDLLDERKFTKDELREFCFWLFGDDNFDGVPDPCIDWMGFSNEIYRIVKNEEKHWNPVTKKVEPWINMNELHKEYGSNTGCSCCIS